jgi:hypothetical protein
VLGKIVFRIFCVIWVVLATAFFYGIEIIGMTGNVGYRQDYIDSVLIHGALMFAMTCIGIIIFEKENGWKKAFGFILALGSPVFVWVF